MSLLILFIIVSIQTFLLRGDILRNDCGAGWDSPDFPVNTNTSEELCYKFVCEAANGIEWFEALRDCQEEGGQLIALENAEQSAWFRNVIINKVILSSHLNDSECDAWMVNAHRHMYGSGLPSWVDGRLLAPGIGVLFSQISEHAPPRGWGGTNFTRACYYLNADGTLHDIECGEKLKNVGYVCTRKKSQMFLTREQVTFVKNKQMNPCTNISYAIPCPTDWISPPISITDVPYCYLFVPKSGWMTWFDAKRTCESDDAQLAIVETTLELEWLSNVTKNRTGDCWAMNFHRSMYGNSYTWANRKGISTVGEWFPGQPIDFFSVSDCGYFCPHISLRRKVWALRPCMMTGTHNPAINAFLCKKPKCNPDLNPSQVTASGIFSNELITSRLFASPPPPINTSPPMSTSNSTGALTANSTSSVSTILMTSKPTTKEQKKSTPYTDHDGGNYKGKMGNQGNLKK